jgi:2-hydroxy-3-keto-5-methylthiopentenyl-1-phosphate phosphatase
MESPNGLAFATDFDGTVTEKDVAALLLREFAGDTWLDIEEDFLSRKISCREALKRQFGLLRGSREELIEYVDQNARIDPDFTKFLSFCQQRGIPVRIVSEGLDFYIEFLLRKYGIGVEFFTNKAHFEDGGIRISYPNASEECEDCGTCKLELLKDWKDAGMRIAYAGDGVSDICPAESCDVVFAKGDLLKHFKREGLKHIEFDGFKDVISEMEDW